MKHYFLISILFILLGLSGRLGAAPIISLVPDRTKIHSGENLFIDVNVSGLRSGGSNSLLGAFSMDVVFNPQLQFLPSGSGANTWGSGLGDVDAGEALVGGDISQIGSGIFRFFEVSLLDGVELSAVQSDSFRLNTLAFYLPYGHTLATGSSVVFSTENVVLSDEFGNELITGSNQGATLRVPEPPMVLLVGIGLALLGYSNRKSGLAVETKVFGRGIYNHAFSSQPSNSSLRIAANSNINNHTPVFNEIRNSLESNLARASKLLIIPFFLLCSESIFAARSAMTFAPPISYMIGASAGDPEVKDINGDLKPDIIVPGYGVIEVFIGSGNGNFLQKLISPDQNGLGPLAVGDLNGDGIQDIVRAIDGLSASSNVVHVLLGQGDGTFNLTAKYNSDTGTFQRSVTLADVNGDGKLDIVVPNYGFNFMQTEYRNTVNILLGNGDGTFKPAVHYLSGGQAPWFVAVADINRDGSPDILVQNAADKSVGILLGNGNGSFQPAVAYPYYSGQLLNNMSFMTTGDINRDGWTDVVAGTSGGLLYSTVGVLLGRENGAFQPVVNYPSLFATNSVAIGDLNGDGFPDIAVGGETRTIGILQGNGDGTFQGIVEFPIGESNPVSVKIVDVNGDRKPDIVSRGVNGTVNIILNTTVFSPSLGDFNGDGCVDRSDLSTLMAVVTGTGAKPLVFDLNGDGKVNIADSRKLVTLFSNPRGVPCN
jgi:hypothetical protein